MPHYAGYLVRQGSAKIVNGNDARRCFEVHFLGLPCLFLLVWLAVGTPHASGQLLTTKRQEAAQAIPFQRLNEQTQRKLWPIVSKPSIFRQLPVETIDCDPDMYLFLVRYPEVIVNIWEVMGITNVTLERTGPYTFNASDGAGTTSSVELVYGTSDMHVLYARGSYQGPLFSKPVQGECVMVLRSGYSQDRGGSPRVANQLDVFLQVDHVGLDLVARTLGPLVGKAADYNFTETTKFISRISEAAEENGPGVERLAGRLTKIDEGVRNRFAELAQLVHHRAALREGQQLGLQAPPAPPTARRAPPPGAGYPPASHGQPIQLRRY